MAEIKFKDLTLDNAFDFCSVLDAIGADQLLDAFHPKEIAAMGAEGKTTKQIGTAIAVKVPGILIKNLPKAKEEICAFFAGCMEWDNGSAVTVEEVKGFKLAQFVRLVQQFCKKDDLTDFFGAVSELFSSARQTSQT